MDLGLPIFFFWSSQHPTVVTASHTLLWGLVCLSGVCFFSSFPLLLSLPPSFNHTHTHTCENFMIYLLKFLSWIEFYVFYVCHYCQESWILRKWLVRETCRSILCNYTIIYTVCLMIWAHGTGYVVFYGVLNLVNKDLCFILTVFSLVDHLKSQFISAPF